MNTVISKFAACAALIVPTALAAEVRSYEGRLYENGNDRVVVGFLEYLGQAAYSATITQDYGSHNYIRVEYVANPPYRKKWKWNFKKFPGSSEETQAEVAEFMSTLAQEVYDSAKVEDALREGQGFTYVFYISGPLTE